MKWVIYQFIKWLHLSIAEDITTAICLLSKRSYNYKKKEKKPVYLDKICNHQAFH